MPSSSKGAVCEEGDQGFKLEVPQATFLADFVGLWLGHVEDALGRVDERGALPIYAFPSGSTSMRLVVSQPDRVTATLTFGADEAPQPTDAELGDPREPGILTEGSEYWAEPVASAFDVERAGNDEAEGQQLALDGKLVLAFSIDDANVSELHLRFARDGLVGAFDGLSLVNARGFLTQPGSVSFRRAIEPSD
jgi:hypothetical protein